ncbi:hypothetical protein PAMP_021020 [Pampus punctatissimus]
MNSCHVLIQVLEGKPIFADCFGNLVPLTKSGQHHMFSFFAFKENRLALFIKESDSDQDADDESEKSDKKYDESESTETFSLKINQPVDPATLASPDLLSDMSDIKMSVILTAEQMDYLINEEIAGSREFEEKETFATVEQRQNRVKERLEKVGEIQRDMINNTRQEIQKHGTKNETWGSHHEAQAVEIRNLLIEEPVLQEICIERKTSSRPATEVKDMTGMISHLSIDMDQYIEQRPVVISCSQEDLVQDRFEQVIVKRDGKRRPPDIKKPIRKKLRDRERSGCSSSEGELERMSSEESLDGDVVLKESGLFSNPVMDPPASPLVVETPIGSIKDRVKALQNKVEEEEVQKNTQVLIPQTKPTITIKKMEADMPELPRVPKSPNSPRSQTERLEETMSVKELMKAFQTGQDPSKNKSGLFEHKAVASSCISTLTSRSTNYEDIQRTKQSPMQELKPQTQAQSLTIFHHQSDVKMYHKIDLEDQSASLIRENAEDSQLISDSDYVGKTVKFAPTIQHDDGSVTPDKEVLELSEKETMSVKELMKAFQLGQGPSKSKDGSFEHKAMASCISTSISESADFEKIQRIEQSPTQEPKPHTEAHSLTIFHQQSDVKKSDKTDVEDQPVSFIGDNSEDSQLFSDSDYVGMPVKFAPTIQRDDGSISPGKEVLELSEKETMSVKALMKAFQPAQETSKSETGSFEHKGVASCISTPISDSADFKEIQRTEQSPMQEPQPQTEAHSLAIFRHQSDVKKSDKTDVEDQPVSFIGDNSEDSQLFSGSDYVGMPVKFAPTIQRDDGSISPGKEVLELSEKETMSVKELMKAFQPAQETSQSEAESFEQKAVASCISTLISDSADSKEIQSTEQSPMQEPQPQTEAHSLAIFHHQSNVKESDKTDVEDQPVRFIGDNSMDSQLCSGSGYVGKTVKFAPTIQHDDGSVSSDKEVLELSEKKTMSVKELMKAFQTGQDPSKSKVGLFEHISIPSSCISTRISESVGHEEIQRTDQKPTQDTKLQTQIQNLTIFHPVNDINTCGNLDLEAQTVSLKRNNSEESQLISDIAYFGETVKTVDTIQCDNGRVSPQEEAFLGRIPGRMQLEEPVISTGRSLSEDLQISPDRRPSEDFSADIKAELEESPEYQLFKQTSTTADVNYQLEAHEEATLADDSDINPASIFSPCMINYFRETVSLIEAQMNDGDQSPESLKHESMAESEESNVDLRTPHSSSGDSENYEGLAVTHQMNNDMLTSLHQKEEIYIIPSQQETFDNARNENTTIDHGNKLFFTQINNKVTEGKTEEPQLQEVYIERKTSSQTSTAVKDMSGMLSLMKTDLDQYLKARPVESRPPQEGIVQEKFEQIILTKEKDKEMLTFVTDENKGVIVGDTTQEIRTPHSSSGESENYEEPSVTHQINNEMLTSSTQRDEMHIIPSQDETFYDVSKENTAIDHGNTLFFTQTDNEVTEVKTEEPQLQEVYIERKTSSQTSTAVKDMSGMLSLMTTDLDQYVKARPTESRPPQEAIVQEKFEQIILTKEKDKEMLTFVTDENKGVIVGDTTQEIRTPHSSSGESENYEEPSVTHQINNEMLTSSTQRDEMHIIPSQDETFYDVSKENTAIDHGNTLFFTQTDNEVTEVKTEEPQLQEVYIERKTSSQTSTAVKDMSGMLSLMTTDLDQYVKARPTESRPPQEAIVQEKFEQIILTKEKDKEMLTFVTDVNKGVIVGDTTQEIRTPHSSSGESENYEEPSVTHQMNNEMLTSSTQRDEMHIIPSQDETFYDVSKENTAIDHGNTLFFTQTDNEVTEVKTEEPQLQEVYIERKTSSQTSTAVKDMSGMLSLMNTDLDQYLKTRPAESRPPQEAIVQEKFEQIILTKEKDKEMLTFVTDENKGVIVGGTTQEIRTPHSSSGESENYEELSVTHQMNNEMLTSSTQRDEMHIIPSQDETFYDVSKENATIDHGNTLFFTQTDNEVTEVKTEEPQLQEVYIERKTSSQTSTAVKDMSGMLSLMNTDLDQYLKTRPAESRPPQEAIVQETFEQIILTKEKDKEMLTFVTDENKGVIVGGTTQEIRTPHSSSGESENYEEPSVTHQMNNEMLTSSTQRDEMHIIPSQDETFYDVSKENATIDHGNTLFFTQTDNEVTEVKTEEPQLQEVYIERKTSSQTSTAVKDMSGMLSLMNTDLDQYLKARPAESRPPQEAIVQETFEQIILMKEKDKEILTFVTDENKGATVGGTTQEADQVKTEDNSFTLGTEETESDYEEAKASRDVQDTSGVLVVNQDNIGGDTFEQMQTDVVEVKDLTPSSVLETPFRDVCIHTKTHHQQSTTEKDMSGMLSLLSRDLDQYLKEKPAAMQCHPEEDLVHESYHKVILTSNHLEDEINGEANEHMQTNAIGVTALSSSSISEVPFQEVCIERKTQQQQSTTEWDMSGMVSLLSSDLDEYLKKKPEVIQCHPEEEVVHESYIEVILTKDTKRETLTFSPEHEMTLLDNTNLNTVDVDEAPESFSCDEGVTKTSPSATSHFNDFPEGTVDITRSYAAMDVYKHDHKDVNAVAVDSIIKTHDVLQLLCSSNIPQRPADLENLKTVVFDDPARQPYHQDSLEASPLMEDRSSKHSPDSIEPSPTRESPCPDSLEGSPTQSKDTKLKMPAKTAVYEDYASQLQACFAYDTNVCRDENEHDEQESNELFQMESESTEDKYSYSAKAGTDGNMCSDPKICDSEKLIRQDSLDKDDSDDDTTHKQFTPEEEMFKMAAKIKTFEEMEQEAKMKRDTISDATKLLMTVDHRDDELELTFSPAPVQISSRDTLEINSEKHVTESIHALSGTTNISSSITERVEIQSQLISTQTVDSSLRSTASHKNEPYPESREPVHLEIQKDKDTVEGDFFHSSVNDTHFYSCVTVEHHPDKEVQPPLTNSLSSANEPQATVCTKELEYVIPEWEDENDVTFNVKPEEQMILCIAEDRKTPDKTPVRTPGDEKTPDPFQFQEGKLFEMTRGGAIDMTKSFGEELEGYAFLHIGQHPVDEGMPEETGEGQTKSLSLVNSESITHTTPQEIPTSSCASDEIPSPKPRTLIRRSSDKSENEKPLSKDDLGGSIEVQLDTPTALEKLANIQDEVGGLESLGLGYLDSTIADLQSDTITFVHSVSTKQSNDSSDSSPDDDDEEEQEEDEDQCSGIEMSFSATQADIPSHYYQDSPPPSAIKPDNPTKEASQLNLETTKDSQISELDQVPRNAEKHSTLKRKTRSEADGDTSKTSNKDSRSYSDSTQFTNKSNLSPSKFPVLMKQKPLANSVSSSTQMIEIQLSETTETSVGSCLDIDDTSSASHRSPDSVIFTYDIPASHSYDSDGNPLTSVQPSSGTENVFESRPAWDDTVETQMQRIIDDQTPECTPVDWQDDADRKEETLAIISDLLGFSWTELARELEFSEDDIQLVRAENPNSLQEQSHALLQRWVEREGKHATENCLIKRLTKINRMDIVHLIETQMNKSVQEQTSRTYAEIEKTLDHSEVSVALSSVQEDADSPRVMRRVESDRRPPPAVSEEDLSVASLLDIPSWAEPVGHIHSESMHGDLLEELEIPHELNPNLWTSEDVITQEPTSYDNIDEQVSTLPKSEETAMGSQGTQVYESQDKVKDKEGCSIAVHLLRAFQGGNQCQLKDECSHTLPLKQCDYEDEQGQSSEILKLPSSIYIRDFSLSLSESDQAETDFSELCDKFSYTPQLCNIKTVKTIVRRISNPNLLVLPPEDHQATLAITEDDTDVDQKSRVGQKCIDEVTAQFFKGLYGHDKIPQVPGMDLSLEPFKSNKEENTKYQSYSNGCPQSMSFIDDDDDDQVSQLIRPVEPIIAEAKYSMVEHCKNIQMKVQKAIMPHSLRTSGPAHMACDSTYWHYNYSSVSPDSDYVINRAKPSHVSEPKVASSSLYLPICVPQSPEQDVTLSSTFIEYEPLTPDSLASEEHCSSFSPVYERSILPAEAWVLNDPITRLSSPESVMSISDYRAMSPDSPRAKKKADFGNILDDRGKSTITPPDISSLHYSLW